MAHHTDPILLASYPRSGNTFLRHIFHDVFGRYSWNSFERYAFLNRAMQDPGIRDKDLFHLDDRHLSPGEIRKLLESKIFKTHELPQSCGELLETRPVVIYLVRDGRDAVVSEAWHRKNITDPKSHFRDNLREAVLAEGGSHFGGWTANVEAWLPLADLVLHFEQLIAEPEKCIRRIVQMMPHLTPDFSRIPTFQSQRSGHGLFVSNRRQVQYSKPFPELFFRKGKVGVWKEEIPQDILDRFNMLHGAMIHSLGYDEPLNLDHLTYRI
ncbi:MAG TPA: sulfotransferase domain-containing protein [Bacteroidales bacterium]|nr:sulfotransferase domain-containing protein [Bacteroidales bacterium]HRZ48267.1 sulfotransferase domain-containing protein [Bacteroidales bacterium]